MSTARSKQWGLGAGGDAGMLQVSSGREDSFSRRNGEEEEGRNRVTDVQ